MEKNNNGMTLDITEISELTGLHRNTVRARLEGLEPVAGSSATRKRYSLINIWSEFAAQNHSADLEEMDPHDRKAWFQSERERLKFEQETAQLLPAPDVYREYAVIVKACTQVLETLPDILERDCALPPPAVARVQEVIDDLRVLLAEKIFNGDSGGDIRQEG